MKAKDATSRVASWGFVALAILFQFDWCHLPSCLPNGNALQQSDPEINEIREKQLKDPASSAIMDYVYSEWHFTQQRFKSQENLVETRYSSVKTVCCIVSILARNVVLVVFISFVVPQSLKYEILSNVYNHVAGAHFCSHI